jgi:xylose isomerase
MQSDDVVETGNVPLVDSDGARRPGLPNVRHAAMIGLMGRQADRFHEYQPHRPLEERLEMVRRVSGIDGIEVVYPHDLSDCDGSVATIKDSGLAVSAVNLNVKSDSRWRTGSFTSCDPGLRSHAIAELKTAMDLSAELGAGMVTCCPLIDGHNYSFETDYLRQWDWLEQGIGEAAQHRRDVRISLEYKLNECRNYVILGDMGRTLFLCERLGLPNVGVTLDIGHALIARETPAEVLCLAARAGRLFYVHFNDNAREWDWDMIPGSVSLWDLLETLFYLRRLDWRGWAAYDVNTRDSDPVETMDATLAAMAAAEAMVAKIGHERLQALRDSGAPARTFRELLAAFV